MYIKLTNGIPAKYTLGQLRCDNSNTSFPKVIPDELLVNYDVYPCSVLERPTFDNLTQSLTEGAFEQDASGNWSLSWVVSDRPLEEASSALRAHRNSMLSNTDWMAVTDRTMTGPEIAYRQSLRDVPQQDGFPSAVTWPVAPT